MQSLLSRLADIKGFQPIVLAISKLILSRISLDFNFSLTVMTKAEASSEMLALALEVADHSHSIWTAEGRTLQEELGL
jgi:hypothetical protein